MAKGPNWEPEIERITLGHMLLTPAALVVAVDKFKYSDFTKEENRRIFEAMLRMENNDETLDLITLTQELMGIVSPVYITELYDITNYTLDQSGLDWKKHFEIFEARNLRMRLFNMASDIGKLAKNGKTDPEAILKRAEEALTNIEQMDNRKEARHIGDIALEYYADIEDLMANPEKNTRGIDTGFYEFDKKIGGFVEGTLVIVAGRPSMGKSAFVLNIALNIAKRNIGVSFYSLEGPEKEIMNRAASVYTQIDSNRINQGGVNRQTELPQIQEACSKISQLPIYIDDTPKISLVELRRKMRRLKFKHPEIKVMIVDYLQIMEYDTSVNKNEALSFITGGILKIAKDLGIVAIVLSQLNRDCEKRTDKRPMLSDLRESGAIEQDAHQVFFLYRDEYYYQDKSKWPGIAEILISKNRNGPAGKREKMNFKPETLTFTERG